jgi:hypothetical protein
MASQPAMFLVMDKGTPFLIQKLAGGLPEAELVALICSSLYQMVCVPVT